jgi:hypothetical protein
MNKNEYDRKYVNREYDRRKYGHRKNVAMTSY